MENVRQKLLEDWFAILNPPRISKWDGSGYRTSTDQGVSMAKQARESKAFRSELIRGHLAKGNPAPLAVVPTDGKETRVLILDIDDKPKSWEQRKINSDFVGDAEKRLGAVVDRALCLQSAAHELGLHGVPFISGGGHGAHIWVVFKKPIALEDLNGIAQQIFDIASRGQDRFELGDGGIFAESTRCQHVHRIEVYPNGGRMIALPMARSSRPFGATSGDKWAFVPEDKFSKWGEWAMKLNTCPKSSTKSNGHGAEKPDWDAAIAACFAGHRKHYKKGSIDNYDGWVDILMIIAATFRDGDQLAWAKEKARQACMEAASWDARAFEKKWQEVVRATNKKTAGSFWHYVKLGGYAGPWPGGREVRDISYPAPNADSINPAFDIATAMGERGYSFDEIKVELTRLFDDWDEAFIDQVWLNPVPTILNYDEHVAPMNRDWAQVITTGTEYLHIPSGDSRSEKAFRDELAHKKLPAPSRGRSLRHEELWREDPHRHKYTGLTAADPDIYHGPAFNVIRPLTIQPKEGDVTIALEHIAHLTRSSGEIAYETLLDFSADIVQRPGATDCQIAILLAGGAGTGKGTYGQLMQMVLCERFMLLTSDKLTSRFNRDLFGMNLVFGDEVSFPGNRETLEQLKSWVSEKQRCYEQKHLPSFTGPNVTRFVFATNNIHAIHLDPDDRRYLLIDANEKQPEAYWRKLHEWLTRPESAQAWLHYLQNRDVNHSRVTAHAPMTPLKKSIIGMSNPLTGVLIDIASDGVCLFDTSGQGAIASNAIVDLLKARGVRHMTAEKVKAEMDRYWPEISKGYGRSRRIRYAHRFRTVSRELPSGEYTDMEIPMFKQNAVWGYMMPPLPELRDIVATRHGVSIKHGGEPWAEWEPDQADPDNRGPEIAQE